MSTLRSIWFLTAILPVSEQLEIVPSYRSRRAKDPVTAGPSSLPSVGATDLSGGVAIPTALPGRMERTFTFYTPEGAGALAGALATFDRGHLVVNVVDMPIKCPVAPPRVLLLGRLVLPSARSPRRRRHHLRHAAGRRVYETGGIKTTRRDACGERHQPRCRRRLPTRA